MVDEEQQGHVGDTDQDILDHMINGPEDEKAEADSHLAAALREEGATGAGESAPDSVEKEPEQQAEEGGQDNKEASKDESLKETNSQRRRRLRRESAERTIAERDRYKAQAAQLQARLEAIQGSLPDREKYGQDEATYIADRSAIAAQHAIVSEDLSVAENRVNQATEQARAIEKQRLDDFMSDGDAKYPGFSEKLRGNLPITPAMAEVFQEESMTDLAWELAQKPEELARIASLPNPILQVKELVSLQAAQQVRAAEAQRSKAPDPIKPLKPNATQAKQPKDMSMTEYYAYRRKQLDSAH